MQRDAVRGVRPRRQPAGRCWRCCSPWLLPLALLVVLTVLRVLADERSKKSVLGWLRRDGKAPSLLGWLRRDVTPSAPGEPHLRKTRLDEQAGRGVGEPVPPLKTSSLPPQEGGLLPAEPVPTASVQDPSAEAEAPAPEPPAELQPPPAAAPESPAEPEAQSPAPEAAAPDAETPATAEASAEPPSPEPTAEPAAATEAAEPPATPETVHPAAEPAPAPEDADALAAAAAAAAADPAQYVCSAAERANASAWFGAEYRTSWQLNCGSKGRALDAVHAASPSRAGKSVLVVGAGLGYGAAAWLARWAPEASVTPRTLGEYWASLPEKVYAPSGGCGQANDPVPATAEAYAAAGAELGAAADVQVWAVEAAPRTLEALAASPLAPPAGPVVLIHAAVTASAADGEEIPFEDCPAGRSGCRAEAFSDGLTPAVPVRTATVDGLLQSDARLADAGGRLFALLVSAEGMEPLVLAGAVEALAGGRVALVAFEYNGIGQWAGGRDTLARVAGWLDGLRYTCFLETRGLLWALGPGCWHDGYETSQLSEVICAHRGAGDGSAAPVLDALYAISNVPRGAAASHRGAAAE